MKRQLFIYLLLLTHFLYKSQVVFCPPGAEWHYLFSEPYPNYGMFNETIKYSGNLIEGVDTLKVLNHTKFFTRHNVMPTLTTHIKQKGDTVYMRNERTNNQWQILYNFSCIPNQSWTNTFHLGPNYTITYTTEVISVTTVQVGNSTVKQLSVNYTNNYGSLYSHTALITEHYGTNSFLFNYTSRYGSDGDDFYESLCYTDSIIGLIQFGDKSCGFSNLTGLENLSSPENGIRLFPNPVTDYLIINSGNGISLAGAELFLRDICGREIKQIQLDQNNKLDLSDLGRGIYFGVISSDSKVLQTTKIIKE